MLPLTPPEFPTVATFSVVTLETTPLRPPTPLPRELPETDSLALVSMSFFVNVAVLVSEVLILPGCLLPSIVPLDKLSLDPPTDFDMELVPMLFPSEEEETTLEVSTLPAFTTGFGESAFSNLVSEVLTGTIMVVLVVAEGFKLANGSTSGFAKGSSTLIFPEKYH